MSKVSPFRYILLKLASRCNLNCDYCYWFTDESVYDKPSILTIEVENAFLTKLQNHIERFSLPSYHILFHGGEPTLFGKERFFKLCKKLSEISKNTGCEITLSITTNGVLVDKEWAAIFRHFNVSVTVSIDGTKEIHDSQRKDFKNQGTHDKVLACIDLLNYFQIVPGILSVANLDYPPSSIFNYFVNELGLEHFDILIPDATHESRNVKSISEYYIQLFELWYQHPNRDNIEIRVLKSIILGLLSFTSSSEGLGYGSVTTSTLLTDGSLEPLDVLRITGKASTKSTFNILTHEIQDVEENILWREAYEASLNLSPTCKQCEFKFACGGGYLPHRWSLVNRFNNPSVYCNDLKKIFTHVTDRLLEEMSVKRFSPEFIRTSI